GRAGANGIAWSFCDAEEQPYLRDINKLISKTIPVIQDHPYPMAPVSQLNLGTADVKKAANSTKNKSNFRNGPKRWSNSPKIKNQ
ncbi:MAG: ATP-dependent helicase, partial [Bacteroidota bacterium]|nr:ATP-dependent helicase [Bacteroidota bacterium]